MKARVPRIPAVIRAVTRAASVAAVASLSLPAAADPPGAAAGQERAQIPWVGRPGITETVAQIMDRDKRHTRPEGMPPAIISLNPRRDPDRSALPNDPASCPAARWPFLPPGPRESAEPASPIQPRSPQSLGISFLASRYADTPGLVPPHSSGDVGPTQILSCSNGRIRVHAKTTGAIGPLNTSLTTFFDSVRAGQGTSNPRVRYDWHSQRWYVICINLAATNNRCLIAVSSGPTITGAAGFTFYFFQHNLVAPAGDAGKFLDYPTLGVDASALYIGGNMLDPATGSLFVVRKSSITSGGPIVATAGRNVGIFTPQGVTNYDTITPPVGFFIGLDPSVFGRLVVKKVFDPGGTPVFDANIEITTPLTTGSPQPVPALGTTGALDARDDRLMMASIFKNKVTGELSLWTAHHMEVDAAGIASPTGNRNGSRWYQLLGVAGAGTPFVFQSGTMFDPTATARSYWVPALVMTGQGHMVIAASAANAAERAQIYAAGRLASDAPGSTQSATLVQASSTFYDLQPGGVQRWGDYSYTGLDPADDMTAWTFQEYTDSDNSWGIRAIQLKAPPPATPTACAPSALPQGAAAQNVVVTGASFSGSGFFDSPAAINHIAASIGGAGVTVNSVTFNSPTQITLNLTVSPAAPAGARSLTVTNPDGQAAAGPGLFTVAPPSCPADLNMDGVIDFADYLEFLNLFDALDPRVDFNMDGVIDFADYLEFLNHFDAGC